ncbi:hypothetical protein C3L33_01555, partial [Rhododendron williamsianum]
MSGGQKQRIAIARAIIKAPRILLLDEATSALDSESERVVQEALDNAAVGRTTVIIAHRLSTIRNANVIAVVQNGQVMETGSHDELVYDDNGLSANAAAQSQRLDNSSKVGLDQVFPVPSFRRLLAMNLPEWRQAVMGCIGAVLFGAIQPLYAFAMGSHYNFAYMGEHLTKRIRERMLSKIMTFEVVGLIGMRILVVLFALGSLKMPMCNHSLHHGPDHRMEARISHDSSSTLVVVCFYLKRVLLKNMSKKALKAQDESSKLAAEAVSNLRSVTAFTAQARVLQMLEKAQEGPRHESIRQSWFAGIGLGTSQCLMACTWALDFWYGGKLITKGYIASKALFETFMILNSTGRVIADAGTMTNDLAKGSDAVRSVFAVLDRVTCIEPDLEGYKPDKITGHVELRDIQFAYPARPDVMVFNRFSINIEAGRSTALVGQSGSGKSTIIGLIERFYDPLNGMVKIDGRNIKSYHLRSLRNHIALVSQEPTLFAGSIRDNITYGASDKIDEAEVIEVAKAANAHEFIACLKDGYNTWCGDRGLQLSGGQKQRIAIARAILKNPAILLLDEATSALDSQSEKVVQDALERVMVGRTSVVVAHRLSTIQDCDMIAVLDKGNVVETGTHSSLLGKGPAGVYFSLVSLQRRPDALNSQF